MRFITFLRRLDNRKKDTVILVSSLILTISIVIGGLLFTQSSFYANRQEKKQITSTSTLDGLLEDIKTTIVPTINDIKENISSVSNEYKDSSFKDFFVPKSE